MVRVYKSKLIWYHVSKSALANKYCQIDFFQYDYFLWTIFMVIVILIKLFSHIFCTLLEHVYDDGVFFFCLNCFSFIDCINFMLNQKNPYFIYLPNPNRLHCHNFLLLILPTFLYISLTSSYFIFAVSSLSFLYLFLLILLLLLFIFIIDFDYRVWRSPRCFQPVFSILRTFVVGSNRLSNSNANLYHSHYQKNM